MIKKLLVKVLIRLKILTRSTEIWVIAYSSGEQPKIEYFFTELEAVNRKNELWDKATKEGKKFSAIINKYSGVDISGPITFEEQVK